jgi:hypothetical protein
MYVLYCILPGNEGVEIFIESAEITAVICSLPFLKHYKICLQSYNV